MALALQHPVTHNSPTPPLQPKDFFINQPKLMREPQSNSL